MTIFINIPFQISFIIFQRQTNRMFFFLLVICMQLKLYMKRSLHSKQSSARNNAWANCKMWRIPHMDTTLIDRSRIQITYLSMLQGMPDFAFLCFLQLQNITKYVCYVLHLIKTNDNRIASNDINITSSSSLLRIFGNQNISWNFLHPQSQRMTKKWSTAKRL